MVTDGLVVRAGRDSKTVIAEDGTRSGRCELGIRWL